MEIRVLDPEKDLALFETAWAWQFDKPTRWQKIFNVWTATREEFLIKTRRECQVDFGIFENGEFCALISLEELQPRIFETHFDCARGTDLNFLIDAIESVIIHVFERGAAQVFASIAGENRAMRRVALTCGFIPTHVEILFGSLGDKILRWQQFVLKPGAKNSLKKIES